MEYSAHSVHEPTKDQICLDLARSILPACFSSNCLSSSCITGRRKRQDCSTNAIQFALQRPFYNPGIWKSLRNCRTENLGPEECPFCTLDDLLVHAHGWVIHKHGSLLIVDLCVHPGVTDEIHDPFFAFRGIEVEAGREVPRTHQYT